ncbi:putative Protein disulfide-isomerase [Blattamonas nauphoetae]|uniref:protein disulfide-isomerase n=1 Tax=Blattamonas nauphoetae TaxID=2049346 RepID=A0ABQ9XYW1_9EUKA|nr:putative Protein disulfide-isomerase [Blattamonas nauphoetae]
MNLLLLSISVNLISGAFIDSLTSKTFDKYLSKGNSFVYFCDPSWAKCRTASYLVDAVAAVYEKYKDIVRVASVNCDSYRNLCKDINSSNYPVIRFSKSPSEFVQYDGVNEVDDYLGFVAQNTGKPHIKLSKPLDYISHQDFHNVVFDTNTSVVVGFVEKDDVGSKQMIKHLEQLNGAYIPYDRIKVVLFDKKDHKEFAARFNASATPSLVLFPACDVDKSTDVPPKIVNGKEFWEQTDKIDKKCKQNIETHSGDKTSVTVLQWVNKKVGAHRTIEGGVESTAGVEPGVADALKIFGTALKSDFAVDIAKNQAMEVISRSKCKSASDKYLYYMEQAMENGLDWIENERSRVDGILAFGQLTTLKEEEFRIRSNILEYILPDD